MPCCNTVGNLQHSDRNERRLTERIHFSNSHRGPWKWTCSETFAEYFRWTWLLSSYVSLSRSISLETFGTWTATTNPLNTAFQEMSCVFRNTNRWRRKGSKQRKENGKRKTEKLLQFIPEEMSCIKLKFYLLLHASCSSLWIIGYEHFLCGYCSMISYKQLMRPYVQGHAIVVMVRKLG